MILQSAIKVIGGVHPDASHLTILYKARSSMSSMTLDSWYSNLQKLLYRFG